MARLWGSIFILVFFSLVSSLELVSSASEVTSSRSKAIASFQSWVDRVGANHSAFENTAKSSGSTGDLSRNVAEGVIVVDQSGAGHYKTINEAINAVPLHNKYAVTIKVNPGIYIERVMVPKSKWRITLQGSGRDVTKITSRNAAGDTGTTYTTSTFGVSAPYFTARNITFEVRRSVMGASKGQAVYQPSYRSF